MCVVVVPYLPTTHACPCLQHHLFGSPYMALLPGLLHCAFCCTFTTPCLVPPTYLTYLPFCCCLAHFVDSLHTHTHTHHYLYIAPPSHFGLIGFPMPCGSCNIVWFDTLPNHLLYHPHFYPQRPYVLLPLHTHTPLPAGSFGSYLIPPPYYYCILYFMAGWFFLPFPLFYVCHIAFAHIHTHFALPFYICLALCVCLFALPYFDSLPFALTPYIYPFYTHGWLVYLFGSFSPCLVPLCIISCVCLPAHLPALAALPHPLPFCAFAFVHTHTPHTFPRMGC